MAIVLSEIIEDSLQAHGQRYVREKHTDHLNKEHFYFYAASNKADVNTLMLNRVSSMNKILVDNEIIKSIKLIELGEILPNLEFATSTEVKAAFLDQKIVYEKEILDLTTKKTNLEGAS